MTTQQRYPNATEVMASGPLLAGNVVDSMMSSVADSLDGGLTSWLRSIGVPRDYHFAFKVKRLQDLTQDQVRDIPYLTSVKEAYAVQYGDWISLIYHRPPGLFNSTHLQKYLTFFIYEVLLEDLNDHHAAFKTTLLYLDDIAKETNLLNRLLASIPDACMIEEVKMSTWTVKRAARDMLLGKKPQINWEKIHYRTCGIILS